MATVESSQVSEPASELREQVSCVHGVRHAITLRPVERRGQGLVPGLPACMSLGLSAPPAR